MSPILRKIQKLAGRVAALPGTTLDQRGIKGLVLGAVYALHRAESLGYRARSGKQVGAKYDKELSDIARQIAAGSRFADDLWLAGFYFNTSLQRLAMAKYRVVKIRTAMGTATSGQLETLEDADSEAFKLATVPSGLLGGRKITTTAQVLKAAIELIELCERI